MSASPRRRWIWLALAAGVAVSSPAFADMGLPLVAVFLPPLWLALLPIILIEGFILSRVAGAPIKRSLLAAAGGNLVSTILGVPLLWLLLAVVELLCCGNGGPLDTPLRKLYAATVQAPWLIPYESEMGWLLPAALVTMAVFCLAMSLLVEAPIARKVLQAPRAGVWRGMLYANLASYLLLGMAAWLMSYAAAPLDFVYQALSPVSMALVRVAMQLAGLFH